MLFYPFGLPRFATTGDAVLMARLILGFEDMLPVAIKFPGVTPARLDRAA